MVVSRWPQGALCGACNEPRTTSDQRQTTTYNSDSCSFYSHERNQTRRDPRLLPDVVLRLGRTALVASTVAPGDDCWSLSNAEHFLDQRGEGAWQPSPSAAADDHRNPAHAPTGAGAVDSPGRLFPAKSAAAEDICKFSRCALRRVVGADVCPANRRTPRTDGFAPQ